MDIIELLEEDHESLRQGLTKIRQNLPQPNLRDTIKSFIVKYELHENIEEEILFPHLELLFEPSLQSFRVNKQSIFVYKEMHKKIWDYLSSIMQYMDTSRYRDLQEAFFNFCGYTESHLSYEERVIFPLMRDLLDNDVLEELGSQALQKKMHFVA
ncbi:MAG: hypothetical protein A3I11_07110 [Elusimicrobia bacterium RIFCSPLOWO2_02_FULL_39_32]|nr:MAG: hypothetical protein A2034_01365 [Elusimicrobia bacterium GWA2_38_7]OGR81474.1 MAG: hypothetical protein A3B80_05515 [Elusimicrobia bacterium RIFCSPHIGHO2_02_FULL_39_36]OGR91957.1 MAG: hypothetical protein A3I11_07110 [Elusimicrobia bacterium RIFCSPLOWO2_02_FULL_39_32]OGR98750.1 MAG: hypothetical protein A3G85_05320 [Elusimicrobia bacterium RIFCSPLOWO2_12_FULL_39_28]